MSRRSSKVPEGSHCHYCGAPATTWDHIWPLALGGVNRVWNCVPACRPCNETKRDQLPTCQCDRCTTAGSLTLKEKWS